MQLLRENNCVYDIESVFVVGSRLGLSRFLLDLFNFLLPLILFLLFASSFNMYLCTLAHQTRNPIYTLTHFVLRIALSLSNQLL